MTVCVSYSYVYRSTVVINHSQNRYNVGGDLSHSSTTSYVNYFNSLLAACLKLVEDVPLDKRRSRKDFFQLDLLTF